MKLEGQRGYDPALDGEWVGEKVGEVPPVLNIKEHSGRVHAPQPHASKFEARGTEDALRAAQDLFRATEVYDIAEEAGADDPPALMGWGKRLLRVKGTDRWISKTTLSTGPLHLDLVDQELPAGLTPAESDVYGLRTQGLSWPAIARQLGRSIRTCRVQYAKAVAKTAPRAS